MSDEIETGEAKMIQQSDTVRIKATEVSNIVSRLYNEGTRIMNKRWLRDARFTVTMTMGSRKAMLQHADGMTFWADMNQIVTVK